jgi:hypothetical protein
MGSKEVEVRLTLDELVVLFHFLARYSETDQLTIEDQAEQRALWNLQCVLERIYQPDHPTLEEARASLRDPAA